MDELEMAAFQFINKDTSEPTDLHILYLNGKFYGTGDLKYMHELITNYVLHCQMYGKEQCEFKIMKKGV